MKMGYIFLIIIIFIIINYLYGREYYCNIGETDYIGDENNKNVLLDYKPQENIKAGNCNKYWSTFWKESNSDYIPDLPPVNSNPELDKQFKFGNNTYKVGFLDYAKLAVLISDNIKFGCKEFKELWIKPDTGEKLRYYYELRHEYDKLNKTTWINRAKEYNPTIKANFSYNKSGLENINKINDEIIKRINNNQSKLIDKDTLIKFGVTPYQILNHMVTKIEYDTDDFNTSRKLYTMKIALFRENDVFTNIYFYQGLISNNEINIINVYYIGGINTSKYLMYESGNNNDNNYYILNDNYRGYENEIINKDMDSVVEDRKRYISEYDIKNQYACFNTDYSLMDNNSYKSEYILPYITRQLCESTYDFYGRRKQQGIFDKPCKKDEECIFYKSNKNYENEYGKCGNDGKCELPVNMENLGYHYYIPLDKYKPMCYNCNSKNWNYITKLDTCCDEQSDKNKYPFLNGPDYAFKDDEIKRYNEYMKRNFYTDMKGKLHYKGV